MLRLAWFGVFINLVALGTCIAATVMESWVTATVDGVRVSYGPFSRKELDSGQSIRAWDDDGHFRATSTAMIIFLVLANGMSAFALFPGIGGASAGSLRPVGVAGIVCGLACVVVAVALMVFAGGVYASIENVERSHGDAHWLAVASCVLHAVAALAYLLTTSDASEIDAAEARAEQVALNAFAAPRGDEPGAMFVHGTHRGPAGTTVAEGRAYFAGGGPGAARYGGFGDPGESDSDRPPAGLERAAAEGDARRRRKERMVGFEEKRMRPVRPMPPPSSSSSSRSASDSRSASESASSSASSSSSSSYTEDVRARLTAAGAKSKKAKRRRKADPSASRGRSGRRKRRRRRRKKSEKGAGVRGEGKDGGGAGKKAKGGGAAGRSARGSRGRGRASTLVTATSSDVETSFDDQGSSDPRTAAGRAGWRRANRTGSTNTSGLSSGYSDEPPLESRPRVPLGPILEEEYAREGLLPPSHITATSGSDVLRGSYRASNNASSLDASGAGVAAEAWPSAGAEHTAASFVARRSLSPIRSGPSRASLGVGPAQGAAPRLPRVLPSLGNGGPRIVPGSERIVDPDESFVPPDATFVAFASSTPVRK